jgi:hypothetical protein
MTCICSVLRELDDDGSGNSSVHIGEFEPAILGVGEVPRMPLVRRFLLGLLVGVALAFPAFALETFTSEVQAQQHCPTDTVVWLNLPTQIWHYKGERWYARTKSGAFVCEKEAAASGARGTRNGQ